MMQIFDDWKLVSCDPYPPRGIRDRSESLAELFIKMKDAGFDRNEIERKMLAPVLDVCVNPNMKDKRMKKEITKSSEEAFRRGLAIAFFEENTGPVEELSRKMAELPKFTPKKESPKFIPYTPEPEGAKDPLPARNWEDRWSKHFDFSFGGLMEDLIAEQSEDQNDDEGNDE